MFCSVSEWWQNCHSSIPLKSRIPKYVSVIYLALCSKLLISVKMEVYTLIFCQLLQNINGIFPWKQIVLEQYGANMQIWSIRSRILILDLTFEFHSVKRGSSCFWRSEMDQSRHDISRRPNTNCFEFLQKAKDF